jgi:hypothetical protein
MCFRLQESFCNAWKSAPDSTLPWGLVLAPTDFGIFSHSVLVGQFGSGEILAFDAVTGRFQGQLLNQDNNAISIPGLWGIGFCPGEPRPRAAPGSREEVCPRGCRIYREAVRDQ